MNESMKKTILELPDEVIGKIIKELYSEYEKKVRNMFNDPSVELFITSRQIVEVLRRHKAEEYASQICTLFGSMYAGRDGNIGNALHEVNAWIAAYQLAEELEVDIAEFDPIKALEYYECRN